MVGEAASHVQWKAPRLFNFLNKRPEVIHTETASPAQMSLMTGAAPDAIRGMTSSGPLTDDFRALFEGLTGQEPHPDAHTLMMLENSSPMSKGFGVGDTPVHEGLHAAYNIKSGAGFPPSGHWDALYQHLVSQHPHLSLLADRGMSPQEVIMAGLARNATQAARVVRNPPW